jgi:adenylate cyclase
VTQPRDRPGADDALLDADQLASRSATTPARVLDLTARGVLRPTADGRYTSGDIHRIRAMDAFEAAGVPIEALVAAGETGRVDFGYYDQLHRAPGVPSDRTYAEFQASLGPLAERLPTLYVAFGLAQPDPQSRLAADEEAFITELLEMFDATGQTDVAMRVVRLFAEAARQASAATMGLYGDVVEQLDPNLAGLPPLEEYLRVFVPWARVARTIPDLAEWLTTRHMSRASGAYSVEQTERLLEEGGYVPQRPTVAPGVAFIDLTGFTRLSEERGDEVAADVAMQLGELARRAAGRHGGRVVKLLGDGVLLRLPAAAAAVDATLELLDALAAAGLPAGHAGIHAGPLIEREGDVFGRSVNLAARVSDVTPSGEVYVTAEVVGALVGSPHRTEPAVTSDLQGIGEVTLFRVVTPPRGDAPTIAPAG